MTNFWELLKESVIVQAIVTLVLIVATVYMWVTNMPVPQELLGLDVLVLGYYFGSKTGFAQGSYTQLKKQ